jgi:hypothetical protein
MCGCCRLALDFVCLDSRRRGILLGEGRREGRREGTIKDSPDAYVYVYSVGKEKEHDLMKERKCWATFHSQNQKPE